MKKKHSTQIKVGATISRLPNMDTKMVRKEETTKEMHSQGELIRMKIRALKGRDLKVFATIAGRMATCLEIVGPIKKCAKSNVASSNMDMEEEWNGEVLYAIEEDKLALIAMWEPIMSMT